MYEVEKLIGRGSYSLVYKARHKDPDQREKTYTYKRTFFFNSEAVRCAIRESHILGCIAENNMDCPVLPNLLRIYQIDQSVVYITDTGCDKNLKDVLCEYYPLSIPTVRIYALQLLHALDVLHRQNIVYLNIKPENILLNEIGFLKLTDFSQSYCSCFTDNWPKLKKFGGDLYYMAPEIANEIEIAPESDIWQLGILAATLVSGNIRPTDDKSILLKMAKEGFYHIKNFELLPRSFRSFISACLNKDYKKRPEANQIIRSSFMDFLKNGNGSIALASPLEASKIAGISLKYLDPCRKDILNAAVDRGFPNITYSLQTENGEIQQRILPYVRQDLADLENGGFTRENLISFSEQFEFPSDSDAPDYECEGLGPRTSKRLRKS